MVQDRAAIVNRVIPINSLFLTEQNPLCGSFGLNHDSLHACRPFPFGMWKASERSGSAREGLSKVFLGSCRGYITDHADNQFICEPNRPL